LDSIDGMQNRWFQRWLSHPSFDSYWQKMTPYRNDFKQIKIPVLAFEGYYNDGQNSGLYYLRELQKYSPATPAYLVIGPYGHFGTQHGGEAELNGYKVDSVALFDMTQITYQWFDYILKNGTKPEMLKGKINYQVMGTNEWQSAPSIDKMYNGFLALYLTNNKSGNYYKASFKKPQKRSFLSQEVDFADRENSNNDYYPDPIIRQEIDTTNGFNFISEPLKEAILINGSFMGEIKASINKMDMDIGVTLYEVLPNGEYFHLSYFIGRASYSKDITIRKLLTPNVVETIPFSNTHLISKQLSKGSRLLIHLNINKNPFSELNYGTGKVVTEESINDAKDPLVIKWYNDSFVKIPIFK
jgi:predicted acyl esterase